MNLYPIILISVILVASAYLIYSYLQDLKLIKTVTKLKRGTPSERRLVLKLLKSQIPATDIFHDLYIEKTSNSYSQIDAVVITDVGILVFEVKDYSGWLFGSENQTYWTQLLDYGKSKFRFYNPIMQNAGHINALKNKLNLKEDIPFFSIIVFDGECELKKVPVSSARFSLVYPRGVTKLIKHIMKSYIPIHYPDKENILLKLRCAVYNGDNNEIVAKHSKNVEYAKAQC